MVEVFGAARVPRKLKLLLLLLELLGGFLLYLRFLYALF